MTTSKITVDLKAKTFTIEVPDDKIESVLARIEALFEKITEDRVAEDPQLDRNGGVENVALGDVETSSVAATTSATPARKRGKGPSKLKSWDTIDLGLTPEQRQSIRDFFAEKKPASQGESVAVLIVKAGEILSKKEFDGNEAHSLFRIVDIPTPKNLTAVFGNMKRDGIAKYDDNKIVVTSFTEDEVNFRLPKPTK